MPTALKALASQYGIGAAYHDIWGGYHPTSDATYAALLAAMHVDAEPETGVVHPPPPAPAADLPHCHRPGALQAGKRIWGLTVQLYGVRSRRNWGIGDFTDLRHLLEFTAAAGGDIVGVNPLHALFPDNPTQISPYSPSHRGFLNVLYIDVEAVAEFSSCPAAQSRVASTDFLARLEALRATTCVDFVGVAQAKFAILRLLFAYFHDNSGARQDEFLAWRIAQGDALEHHARFEALQAHFRAQSANVWGWPAWPAEYRDPDARAVASFAADHEAAVSWSAWLQWLADEQLQAASARARELGMAVGLYQDLAVGANPGGSEIWSWQAVFADGAQAGAPPDELNLLGQAWGLPPFVPHRLAEVDFAPFVEILRANMKHAGALRIDHVMGLQRIFWVPNGTPASEGAYVHYPFEDMLRIVAEESRLNACLVIGEDLGTVPDGFRARLFDADVLSYHPLLFERYPDANFRLPEHMPAQALVAAGTHDLPTLAGFWQGIDIDIRTELHLFPNEEVRQHLIAERNWDRGRLLWVLQRQGLLAEGASTDPATLPELTHEIVIAIHAYLARSSAQILVVQPEDLLGVVEQANVPGTLEDQHPNWQHKLPVPIEDWEQADGFQRCLAAIRKER